MTRFTRVTIGSGDGIFADAADALVAAGIPVTVVSRRDSLSARLASAAGEVIYLDAAQSQACRAALRTGEPFLPRLGLS
jgi:NAD(P)-dependent dehydrogenase (short-subunit alcohol dehydrogenase family)